MWKTRFEALHATFLLIWLSASGSTGSLGAAPHVASQAWAPALPAPGSIGLMTASPNRTAAQKSWAGLPVPSPAFAGTGDVEDPRKPGNEGMG